MENYYLFGPSKFVYNRSRNIDGISTTPKPQNGFEQRYKANILKHEKNLKILGKKNQSGDYLVNSATLKEIKTDIKKFLGIPQSFKISLKTNPQGSAIFKTHILGSIKYQNKRINFSIDLKEKKIYLGAAEVTTKELLKRLKIITKTAELYKDRKLFYTGSTEKGVMVIVTEIDDYRKVKGYKEGLKAYVGKPGKMREVKISRALRMRDGGTMFIKGKINVDNKTHNVNIYLPYSGRNQGKSTLNNEMLY